jgi:hypothetical protein
MHATEGDWLVMESPHVGEVRRRGRIVGVRGEDGGPPYAVRWDDADEHETLVYPGPGTHVEHGEAATGRP